MRATTAGSAGDVVKLLSEVNIHDAAIERALSIIAKSVDAVVDQLSEELRSSTSSARSCGRSWS